VITGTLPSQFYPKPGPGGVTATDPFTYAVHGQDVIWRLTGPVTKTGRVTVTTCVSQALSTQDPLTHTFVLEDVLRRDTPIAASTPLSSEADIWVTRSCTFTDTEEVDHPHLPVPPLVPNVIIENRAAIRSEELGAWTPSNVVVTRRWPTAVYLPLVFRQ
jgi:hypothetical protein